MAINRVATLASHNALVTRMLNVQSNIHEAQMQVSTEKKSQNYTGIALDAERLVSFENQIASSQRYIETNTTGELRLNTMQTSVSAVEKVIRTFRTTLADYGALDLTTVNAEEQRRTEEISADAFAAMKDIESYLNVRIEGRYLFSGGKTDTRPVDLQFDNLTDFQAGYTGATGSQFPTTRAAHVGDTDLTNATTGNITFNTAGTITATTASSFNNLPIGSTITVTGATNAGDNQTYTITANTGTVLTVTPVPGTSTAGETAVNFAVTNSYYQGDQLELEHRVDDDRSVTLGINASQGAFEKAIRAMGIIAQDALEGNTSRIQEALNLLNDALIHDESTNPTEETNDIMQIQRDLGRNVVVMASANTVHEDYIGFLQTRQIQMENVDLTESVTRLNDYAMNLDVSMRTMARIQRLTLADYI